MSEYIYCTTCGQTMVNRSMGVEHAEAYCSEECTPELKDDVNV